MNDLADQIINSKKLISDGFHCESSIDNYDSATQETEIPESWVKINYKTYPRLEKTILPSPLKLENKLGDVLKKRRSARKFDKSKISLDTFSTLIQLSTGVTKINDNDWDSALRAYPSAGARYPLELYIVANQVSSLAKGLYHYNIKQSSLETLRKKNLSRFVAKNTSQDFVGKASFILIISAVLDRTRIKYGERGYRFVLLDAGHLAQNVYLVASALGLKCCAIGGFIDEKFNNLLDLEGQNEKVIYLLAIGS